MADTRYIDKQAADIMMKANSDLLERIGSAVRTASKEMKSDKALGRFITDLLGALAHKGARF